MKFRAVLFLLCLAVSACDRPQAVSGGRLEASPDMQAPTSEAAPGRRYNPVSESARVVTGKLTLTLTTRMPDAEAKQSMPTEVLSLRAETGLTAEAALEGSAPPSTPVEGQTIRALMDLPVEASQVLVYHVTDSAAPADAQKPCGAKTLTRILVWEPDAPGEAALRLLTLAGDAPGRPGAQLCMALAYERAPD